MPKDRFIKCPSPCGIRLFTKYREGIIIDTHHFDSVKQRRVLHEVFIPYESILPDKNDEHLPSIDSHDTKTV